MKCERSKSSSPMSGIVFMYFMVLFTQAGFFSALLREMDTLGHASIMSKSCFMKFGTTVS